MATIDLGDGNIEDRELVEEMRSSYMDYAMSVIVGRALPDVRDGLKPVHRRVLFTMQDLGLQPNRPYVKCARVVGDCMGKYHPHGDSAIYDTLVRLGQKFASRYPLVDTQGNFGNIDGDPAAAMRYTECRLSPIAVEMLRDLDEDVVDFEPNYDEQNVSADGHAGALPQPARERLGRHRGRHGDEHPAAQPARDHRRRDRADRRSRDHDRGPDGARQGPRLPDRRADHGSRRASATPTRPAAGASGCARSRTSSRRRAATTRSSSRSCPYQVRKGGDDGVLAKIAELVHEKVITGIRDIADQSDRNGMRIWIELKRGELAKVVLNQLYKHTPLQTTFGANVVTPGRWHAPHARAEGAAAPLRRPPEGSHHPAHQVPARAGAAPPARVGGLPDRARQPRPRDRDHPQLGRRRRRARDADDGVRALRGAGARHPRPPPARADRAAAGRGAARARRAGRSGRGAALDPRRRGPRLRDRQGGAERARHALRRRPPHRDRAGGGRARPRAADPRRGHGHLDHPDRLHQARGRLDLPPAEARRRRA